MKVKSKPKTPKVKPKNKAGTPRMTREPLTRRERRLLFAFLAIVLAAACLMSTLFVCCVNFSIKRSVKDSILSSDSLSPDTHYDCILVLGCGVKADGQPSDMLYDRIKTACKLYLAGIADKILFSGDHGREHYDEVNTMKRVAHEEFSVPLEDIFLDHAGFSTYETMARAANIFGVKTAVVVTQEYHLYRALFLAKSFGIEAVGTSASIRGYAGQAYRDLREVAARLKDLISAVFKPDYVGGETIDISSDGRVTHDS